MVSVGLLNSSIRLLGGLPFEVSERLLLVLLAWRADENGETHMNRAELGRQSGLSRPTIRKTLARLELMGLVSGKRLTVGVRALARLSAGLETENGLPSEMEKGLPFSGGENGKQFAILGKNGTENGLPKNGKQFAIAEKTKMENVFPSDGKTVCQKMENSLPPYRQTIKTRSTACACARETEPTVPPPPEETRARSPETGRSEAARIQDAEAFAAFLREYPKRSMARATVAGLWAALEAEGVPGRRLLGAMREAAATKQWLEESGRFVPRAENWLRDRGFEQFLEAADRRASAPTQAQREAAEAAETRERMAALEEAMALMEDEEADHV